MMQISWSRGDILMAKNINENYLHFISRILMLCMYLIIANDNIRQLFKVRFVSNKIIIY